MVTSEEAQAWLRGRTPDLAPVLDELGADALPASIEVTLRPDATSGAAMGAFVEMLQASGPFAEVDYGQEWVARFSTFISLLVALALALGGIGAVATLFLVGNTTHLIIHSRRDELEIMRLVGAADGFILGPFVLEGALQGLLGGLLGVAALYGIHQAVGAGAARLLSAAVGGGVRFLDPAWLVALLFAGVVLGAAAAGLSARRFLLRLP
jgi:cell division transport system permease protein